MYSAVTDLSPQAMRAVARYADVHLYRETNDVLHADRSFVAIHTGEKPATGPLRLPRQTPVYDVFACTAPTPGADALEVSVPPCATALSYLGDLAAFKAAVERW